MVHDGKRRISVDSSFIKPEPSHQNLSLPWTQGVQRSEAGKNLMDLEERRYSDLYRNSTEELFIKTLMEGSAGMPVPTMDMLGFKNLSQNFRVDSEELFNSWLTNGENQDKNSTSIAHRTRQASRRITSESSPILNQHNAVMLQRKSNENPIPEHTSIAEESLDVFNQHPSSSAMERGVPASNLYLAKAWFHSSQPMTRSRSSELRKRYVALQNSQTAFGMEAMHKINASEHGIIDLQQEFTNSNGFNKASVSDTPNQLGTFMSPSNSSSSNFNSPHMGTVDNVSSVVSMLKGTLENKRLNNRIEKSGEDISLGFYVAQEVVGNPSLDLELDRHVYEAQRTFQDPNTLQVLDPEVLQRVQGLMDIEPEEIVNPTNLVQMNTVSREQSQSESCAATPTVSIGFDAYDGPSNSGQARSNCESSRKQVGNEKTSENGIQAKDIRERIYDTLKEDRQQKGGLVRYGSVTSAGSDKGDPTKKRRVERSRKMAEAKERVLTPAIPSDMQSVLKRCENLEKEVRSLKLNLSFMNRKDSEQTKQIEELQKQNDELTDEKERLLEEIERIISATGKM